MHARAKFRLAGGLLDLAESLLGLLGGLLGNPQSLPSNLLRSLEALLRGLLDGPKPLLSIVEGGEKEALVDLYQLVGESAEALLLLAGATGEGLRRAQVVLGLLPHGLGALPQPLLGEPKVALLELRHPRAASEPLLGCFGVLLLEPQELHPILGQTDAAALEGREVLG